MKKLYLLLAIIFSLYIIYINSTAENIIYMDQIRMTSIIEKYFNGNLSFSDLWSSYLGHRSLGYHLIFVINAALFHLNSFIEINISAICLLFIAVIFVKSYYVEFIKVNVFKDGYSDKLLKGNLIAIILVIFSLNKWETALLGLGLNEYLVNVLFIVMFYLFNDFLVKKKLSLKKIITLFLALNFSIIFFSLAYVAPFILALYLVIILDFLLKKKEIKVKLSLVIVYTINTFILCLIYLYNINEQSANEEKISILNKITTLVSEPISILKFYFFGLSGSVIGIETAQKLFSNGILLLLGIFVFLFYSIAIYLFFKIKLYNVNYFPFLLIIYSLAYMALVLIGRLDYGEQYGMSSRYTLAMMYGLIGIVWIFSLVNQMTIKNFKLRIFNWVFILILILSIIITNLDEIRKSPYRNQSYQNMRTIAFNEKWNDWGIFQSDLDLTKKAFETLKKHNLNVYYDYSEKELNQLGTNINNSILGEGVYKEEENFYWISKSGNIQIKSGTTGYVEIEGTMNNYFQKNNISIYINEKKMVDEIIEPGKINISFYVEPNKVHKMRIEIEKTFIPYDLGINNDKRELGIIINKLEIR